MHDVTGHKKEVKRHNICSYIPLPLQLVAMYGFRVAYVIQNVAYIINKINN